VVLGDINFTSRPYDPWMAYGQSKTANVLFAVEATRRWGSDGITANAVHPGAIADSNLSRHMKPDELAALRSSGMFT
jgi:NAD(P)-dependent dehydrogenase (short-subunit alcohol dehydrogenase family)